MPVRPSSTRDIYVNTEADTGEIEAGVRETLRRMGVENPSTAPELLAIDHARTLDNLTDEKNRAGISRELRLCLEEARIQPDPITDQVGALIDRQ